MVSTTAAIFVTGSREAQAQIIVGRSMPEDRAARYLGLVYGYDRKPKRRLVDLLKSQELQANQDITFLTDGGEAVRACGEHGLDWFHITMRITVLSQYAVHDMGIRIAICGWIDSLSQSTHWRCPCANLHKSRQLTRSLSPSP